MNALLIDAGNTRVKWGEARDGVIRRTGEIAQAKIRNQGLQVLTTKLPTQVDAVLASNVAGAGFAARLSGVIRLHCNRDVHFAKTSREAFGVRNGYRQPRRMGVDRWMAMIGAWAEVEDACVVVDAGTAVTIDAIDSAGKHLGGHIIPGIQLMMAALASETSDVPAFAMRRKPIVTDMSMFGRNTSEAVEFGVLNALVAAVDRVVEILERQGHDPVIVLTGGDAPRMLASLAGEALHRPHLVLMGLIQLLDTE